MRNGHIKRLTDADIQSSVLEIMSANVSTTYITAPADPKETLGIKVSNGHDDDDHHVPWAGQGLVFMHRTFGGLGLGQQARSAVACASRHCAIHRLESDARAQPRVVVDPPVL